MGKFNKTERKHRLKNEFYIGEVTVAFTACIKERKKLFADVGVFNEFERILLNELKSGSCSPMYICLCPIICI